MPPIQAFIFDSDGTLVDSEVPSMDVFYEQALSPGVRFAREEAHRVFRGLRMAEVIASVSARMPQVHAIRDLTEIARGISFDGASA